MLSDLLDFLSREGYHRAIDDFFREFWQRRRRQLETRLTEADANGLDERLEVLRKFLDENGFMPEIDVDDGTVEIRECNCPFAAAVDSTYLPCRLEADFLEKIVGKDLDRVSYIPDDSTSCTYRSQGEDGPDR